ncbi:MAG TPA: DUF11 domain-containing protein [Chloroflexi bacterium]|nr:DUF11 domain-containing protein [Chloroflexota bacterium]
MSPLSGGERGDTGGIGEKAFARKMYPCFEPSLKNSQPKNAALLGGVFDLHSPNFPCTRRGIYGILMRATNHETITTTAIFIAFYAIEDKAIINYRIRGTLIMKKVIAIFLLLGFLVTILPTPAVQAAGDDWPMYYHDAKHSGRTAASAVNDQPLYLQWAYAFGERVEIEVQPILADGVLYVGVMNGEMHAIDALTGETKWIAQPGGPIPHTAAVSEGRVVFGSLDGKVYALNAGNGSTVWAFSTGAPVVSAPAIVNGIVYIGSTDGRLYAISLSSGAEVWHYTTGGPVVSSPAVANGRVYFGSEDLKARAVSASSGALLWETQLSGAAMHNTHPVVSDDGNVVIFQTVKPGVTSYVPTEGYPNVSAGANPVSTWNTYYQQHPERRTLYYLKASDGSDLWDPSQGRYVPMPIPYWGLIHPVIGPDGRAWFPSPAGSSGNNFELDHDDRLIRVDLGNGAASQVAGGSGQPEFQLRTDEIGRAIFAGGDFYYAISEDLGVYRPPQTGGNGGMRALFSNGDPSGYNFGDHMHPHSPLPTRHLWRYGGAVAMGGVPGASVPIVANGMVYFISYGWLYALGPQDRGLDPATSFPPRDAQEYIFTYPRAEAPTVTEIQAEVEQRVADILARGPNDPPVAVRWEQPGTNPQSMQDNEYTFEVYGTDADLVRVLTKAYPFLPPGQQSQVKAYLSALLDKDLLNTDRYANERQCYLFGQQGIFSGSVCSANDVLDTAWYAKNPNLVGMRLYALWQYADTTGDWDKIQSNWSFIKARWSDWVQKCGSPTSMGFCDFESWREGRLNLPAQIAAAESMRNMASHLGDTAIRDQAQEYLTSFLEARLTADSFVPQMYDQGRRQPFQIRLDSKGVIRVDDVTGPNSPYNNELIPYDPTMQGWRNRDNDPSQLTWWEDGHYKVDACIGFMHYQGLTGYFPLTPALTDLLRNNFRSRTEGYVRSYEINAPWWWMSDLAHHTTCGGEHLYHSPTLAWSLFQVKAHILQEDWDTLARELPIPASFNSRYDLYRLENLVTLLDLGGSNLGGSRKEVSSPFASQGDTLTYVITVQNSGAPLDNEVHVSDTLPQGMQYVAGSLTASRGAVDDSAAPTLRWSGTLGSSGIVTIRYQARVVTSQSTVLRNVVTIDVPALDTVQRSADVAVNQRLLYLPLLQR